MLLIPDARITVAGLQPIDSVLGVNIQADPDQFTATARVELVRALEIESQTLREYFSVGQRITIELGYGRRYRTEFEGYVQRVEPGETIVIHAEDASYWFKRRTVSRTWKQAALREILADLLAVSGAPLALASVADMTIHQLVADNATPLAVLESLRREYNLQAWIRPGTFDWYVGSLYQTAAQSPHTIEVEYETLETGLTQRPVTEPVLIRAVSIDSSGVKSTVEAGQAGGVTFTLPFAVDSAAALKDAAERELERFSRAGFSGSVTVLGVPHIRPGDSLSLSHPRIKEMSGIYHVDRVTTSWRPADFRRQVDLGPQIPAANS